MSSEIRVGIIQFNPTVGDIAGNADRVTREYRAVAENADIVATSELSALGYPPRDLLHRPDLLAAQRRTIERLARHTENGPPLVLGAATGTDHGTGPPLHNAAVVLRDGHRHATYAKRLLPTYDVFDEHRYFQPGEEPLVIEVDGIDVGLTICEDAWHDTDVTGQRRHGTNPLAETAKAGADLILTLSASPFSLDKPARRERRFTSHAEATGSPVVFINQVGGNDELIFDGHSLVVHGNRIVERLPGFEPTTAVVTVGGETVQGTVRRFDRDRETQARAALGLGVRDYFAKTGFEEAIIGLSGGIDSSVTAALATDALGPDSVYGVALPSVVSSEQSVADARTVAENLGIAFDVVPIADAVAAIKTDLSAAAQPIDGIAVENLQARVRGDVLMSLANQRDALVLTPDNKSEAAVGYCTLYGDTVGALAPLGDCYKRMVYELAESFNRRPPVDGVSQIVPSAVIDKPPSAELRENQTDADDLPPYDVLDSVLEDYIEDNLTGAELGEQYDTEVTTEAVARITASEFKRRQTPPPLRITRKALGRGWNYPVAAEYRHVTESK
ncbi:MAG: NAD+ synthase [Halovenus sp.]